MKSRTTWIGVACACVAALLYSNTLRHGFALDDFPTIYGNRLTMSGVKGIPTLLHTAYWYGFDGLNDWLYRPLSMVMFAIEWQLAPNTPALGHWVNVLVYAAGAFVLFRFLCDLLDEHPVAIPLAISLLWLVHPIHTEVVANIKSRDELLAFLFSILTLWECLRYAKAPRARHMLLAGLWFFLALMAKESPITLIAIIPLTLFVFARADIRHIGRTMIPVAVAAVLYLGIRSLVLTSLTGDPTISLIDNSLVAAPDFAHREATAFYVAAMYLKLLFVPHPLSSDYSFRQIPMVGFDNSIALGSLILHGALGVYALLRVRQRDPIAYGILFYLIGMSLVGNVLFLTHSTMADRFLFTPSLGFCAALVFAMTRLLPLSKPFALAVGCIVVAFALKTWTRNPDWRNDTAIFAADARHSPNSARVHFLNGNHTLQELKQGKVAAGTERQQYIHALSEFHRAIELYPAYAEPHMGIGEAYTYGGDVPAAIDWYRQMVARNPRFAVGFYALGLVYHSKGDADSARVYLNKAYALDPTLKK